MLAEEEDDDDEVKSPRNEADNDDDDDSREAIEERLRKREGTADVKEDEELLRNSSIISPSPLPDSPLETPVPSIPPSPAS